MPERGRSLLDVEGERPEKACRLLVDMANARGGDDNITVIVLNIKTSNGLKGAFARIGKTFKRVFQ